MPEFYITIARKKYFSRILGGHVPLCPPRLLHLCVLNVFLIRKTDVTSTFSEVKFPIKYVIDVILSES